VVAVVDGAATLRETLDQPNAQLLWRTRRVTEITLSGEGTVSFIGFHLPTIRHSREASAFFWWVG
jgi:hypothetical protein